MYLQDSKLFRVCQVRNEDIDMPYVALYIIYTIYLIYTSLKQPLCYELCKMIYIIDLKKLDYSRLKNFD